MGAFPVQLDYSTTKPHIVQYGTVAKLDKCCPSIDFPNLNLHTPASHSCIPLSLCLHF